MTRILTLASFLLISSFASGQVTFTPGYVVLNTGDTIKGEIKHNPKKQFDLFSKVMVKIDEQQRKSYKADKVKSYTFGETTFIAKNMDGEMVFMKRISEGAIDLYEFQYEWINAKNETEIRSEYYLEKEGSAEPVRIKSGRFRKQIAEMMADHQELVKDLEEKKYDVENLAEVVESYNKWAKTKS
jgi:hypothetical protein